MIAPSPVCPPTIQTDRLVLRPFTLEDVDALHETTGRADVMQYYVDQVDHSIGWTRAQAKALIVRADDEWQNCGYGSWAVIHGGRLVGYCGLTQCDYIPSYIGYAELRAYLHPDVQGRGVATETGHATLTWAFGVRRLPTVVAGVLDEHTASHRLAKRFGMRAVETLPYRSPLSGISARFIVYRRDRS